MFKYTRTQTNIQQKQAVLFYCWSPPLIYCCTQDRCCLLNRFTVKVSILLLLLLLLLTYLFICLILLLILSGSRGINVNINRTIAFIDWYWSFCPSLLSSGLHLLLFWSRNKPILLHSTGVVMLLLTFYVVLCFYDQWVMFPDIKRYPILRGI